jgi:regulatory protein
VIEALEPVLGKKTCTVQVDGDSFEVAQRVVEELDLRLGATLTASQCNTLQTAAHRRAAAAAALRYLQRRPRTGREVTQHLMQKGHPQPAVAGVLEDLRASGIVDDERFAAWYVEARLTHRPTGRSRLVREMAERGIEWSTAETATEARLDRDSEWALARQAARGRGTSLRRLPPDKAKRRLASFLSGRGFPMEMVRRLCFEEIEALLAPEE